MSSNDHTTENSTATSKRISPDPAAHPSDLTQFQINILRVLGGGDAYGLAIKRDLEEYYGCEVNHGRMYPNLDELVSLGLIEKSERDKRTNNYHLTEAGHATLRARVLYLAVAVSTEVTE